VRHSVDPHLPFAATLFLVIPPVPGIPWDGSASRRIGGLVEAEGPRRCCSQMLSDGFRSRRGTLFDAYRSKSSLSAAKPAAKKLTSLKGTGFSPYIYRSN